MKKYILTIPAFLYILRHSINLSTWQVDLDFSSFLFGGICLLIFIDVMEWAQRIPQKENSGEKKVLR